MTKPINPLCYLLLVWVVPLFAQPAPDSLRQKGEDLYQQGIRTFSSNKDSASLLLQEALPFFEAAAIWSDYVKCLNGLAFIAYHKNDFVQYQQFNEKAVETAQKYLPSNDPSFVQATINLHAYYYTIGDFDQAIKLMNEVTVVAEKDTLYLSDCYHNLGNSYRFKGDYARALEYLEKTLDLQKDSLSAHLVPRVYQDMARVHQDQGQLDSAVLYVDRSLNLLQQSKIENSLVEDYSIEALFQLSDLWCQKNNTTQARRYLTQIKALDLEKRPYEKVHYYEMLGQVYERDKKYGEAMKALLEAENIAAQKERRNTPPFIARRKMKMGELRSSLQQSDAALQQYQKALQVLSPGFVHEDYLANPDPDYLWSQQDALTILEQKAQLLWQRYQEKKELADLMASFETYYSASQLIRAIRQGIVSTEAKNILSEKSIPVYEGAIRNALLLYREKADLSFLLKAFALAESNKGLLLLESLNEQAAKGQAGIPDSLLEEEKSLQLQLNYWQQQQLEQKGEELPVAFIDEQIFALKRQQEQLIARLEKEYPRYFEIKYRNSPISINTLQQQLERSKSTTLEYFVGEQAIYLFGVNADHIYAAELDNRSEILAATAQLQNLISQAPVGGEEAMAYSQFVQTAHQLYQQLLAPAKEWLTEDQTSLIIIPDHELNYLPFELLLTATPSGNKPSYRQSNLAYLMERYAISYDYSATLFAKSQDRTLPDYQEDFAGFAPSFKGREGMAITRTCTEESLYDLPCAHQEVEDVLGLLSGKAFGKKEANKLTFEREAPGSRIIHLATHACIDEQNSLFNKIYLTDDYLTNADLYNLHLNAELAVLSACNTGAGQLVKGEGVMSLARGFITAGCASILVSRWSVNDCATSEIMLRFYRQLKAGQAKNEALRQAKIDYLAIVEKSKTHPYYWAAFVQFGNVKAMEFSSNTFPKWLLWGGVLLGLCALFFQWKKS